MSSHPESRRLTQERLYEEACDELLSRLLRSDLDGADPERTRQYLADAVAYLAARYPALSENSLQRLHALGEHFARQLTGIPV